MAETLPELKSYCSKEWADAFFSSFLWSTNWDSASDKQKLAALCTATNLIQRFTLFYNDSGEAFTYEPNGALEIPDLLKEATKTCISSSVRIATAFFTLLRRFRRISAMTLIAMWARL